MAPAVTILTDAVIAVIVAAVPLYVIDLRQRSAKGQDIGFGPLFAAILTVGWVLTVYGSFFEVNLLRVKTYDAVIGSENGGRIRAAVVSDTHLGLHKGEEWMKKVVRKVNSTDPDVVFLVGDFVTVAAGTEGFGPMKDFKSRFGTYAVLGNWDYRVGAVDVRKAVESNGVEVLTNESVVIGWPGQEVYVLGLDDGIYGLPDWGGALEGVPIDAVTILLGHEPDFAPMAEVNGIDLVVSGHTHGGQVRLPGIGAAARLPIRIPQEFDVGMFDWGQTKLFITPGVGESGARARLLNPPEISVLDIRY